MFESFFIYDTIDCRIIIEWERINIIIKSFEELLEEKGSIIYTNVGASMMPLLRQRKDIIEIRKKETERCKKYDVVLYKRENKYVLHRILKVLPDGYIIAGDNNTFIETDIKDEDILGIMTRIVRNGKTITPENWFYKIYIHLWCDCYPVRMYILRLRRIIILFFSKVKIKIRNIIRKQEKYGQ